MTVTTISPTPAATTTAPAEEAPSVAATTPAPPADPPVWERYGALPAGTSGAGFEEYFEGLGATICPDVQAGRIEAGFLHGFVTGGPLPEYVKPTPAGVWQAVQVIERSCPDDLPSFVALLDAYDAEHGPY